MARDIDLALLRAFLAVARTGNMTVAGRHLHLTQAAVSQQIRRLEDLFGKSLFDRRQRRLRLTASGERLVSHAESIVSQNDEIWGLMTSPEFEGLIRLGVPHDLVAAFMPTVLRDFAKSWPKVEIQLLCRTSAELRQALAGGEIELTLATEAGPGEAGGGETLLADQLVWAGAPGGTAHQRRPLPVTLGDEHCAFRAAAARALAEANLDWRFTCAIDDISAMCATLEADLAVAPLLSQTVPEGLKALDGECDLPPLPVFYINLYVAEPDPGPVALELAGDISQSFAARFPKAA